MLFSMNERIYKMNRLIRTISYLTPPRVPGGNPVFPVVKAMWNKTTYAKKN